MGIISQLTVNSLIAGSIYALVASGFAILYATNRYLNLAHGAVVAFSGYLLYTFFTLLGIPFAVSIVLTLLSSAAVGVALYKLVFFQFQKRKASNVVLLIASIALLILIENAIQLFYGASVKSIGLFDAQQGQQFYGAAITPLQITIIVVSIAIFFLTFILMRTTRLGRNMRAVADNKELASIVGINPERIALCSFAIGSLLAGIAGILIGLEQNLYPTMGTNLIIKGFTGAIIGGAASVPGAVLGSYLLGFAENYGVWFLPSGYKDAIAFGLLFIFLLFRPKGILGERQ